MQSINIYNQFLRKPVSISERLMYWYKCYGEWSLKLTWTKWGAAKKLGVRFYMISYTSLLACLDFLDSLLCISPKYGWVYRPAMKKWKYNISSFILILNRPISSSNNNCWGSNSTEACNDTSVNSGEARMLTPQLLSNTGNVVEFYGSCCLCRWCWYFSIWCRLEDGVVIMLVVGDGVIWYIRLKQGDGIGFWRSSTWLPSPSFNSLLSHKSWSSGVS